MAFPANSFKFFWRTENSKPATMPFGIVACTFSDNLCRNSCILNDFSWWISYLFSNSLVILFNYLDTTPQAKRRVKYLSWINKDYWLIDWRILINARTLFGLFEPQKDNFMAIQFCCFPTKFATRVNLPLWILINLKFEGAFLHFRFVFLSPIRIEEWKYFVAPKNSPRHCFKLPCFATTH